MLWALEAAAAGESISEVATDQTYLRAPGPRRGSSTPAVAPMQALYLTGHSLGGAMAAVLARMLVDVPRYRPLADRLAGVYTYGQPMVATPEAAAEADRALAEQGVPLIRYVYRDDPVPRLPPAYTGRFAHFGQERRFVASWPDRPNPTTIQSAPWRLDLATGVAAYVLRKSTPLRSLPWTADLEHHLPHRYVAALALPGKPSEFGVS